MGTEIKSLFLNSIFKEHRLNKKSLLILGEGMSSFLILYEYIWAYYSPTKLLIVLNYPEDNAKYIQELLDDPNNTKFGSIGKTLKQNRSKKYLELNVAFVTS